MALLHALANTPTLALADGPIKDLFKHCQGLDPEESADLLEATNISKLHAASAETGQTSTRSPVLSHYLAFINYKNQLLELDGWAHSIPINHGPIEHDLLHSAANRVKKMMEETGSIMYTLMAIAPTEA
ncbi:hypothetical protein M422DRAFT_69294 [Sphaerobolus stellatus SS14]|uniref:ubiquitinyl hydrolase 1 n=1 Tax=Sphaerobolus stellatus (strain SS14) TaxID=990650 RepID=A0A0C9VJM2_SPHS4|nr:hypothetical protein M422DRAFT_69294 [Sphaerobolus stellatus SS14]